MTLFFRITTGLNLLLLLFTWGTGYLRPASLGSADAFHMPLGLLSCVVTLLVQAHFFSYLLTTSWDVDAVARKQEKDPEAAVRTHAIKARLVPVVMVPALSAVLAGILGMALRAGVAEPWVHRTVTGLMTLGTLAACWLEPRAAGQLEEILEGLGLTDEARRELGNR